MPAKFDFLSPGVLLREIDQSQVPAATTADGLMIVGIAPQGPTMKPVRVRNLDNFLQVFGNPISGKGIANDVWRNGPYTAPTYGMYAAQAWLSAESSPVTFVRLAGEELASQSSGIRSGWHISSSVFSGVTNAASAAGPYALLVYPSASGVSPNFHVTGTIAAIMHSNKGFFRLSGTLRDGNATTGLGKEILSLGDSSKACEFHIQHMNKDHASEGTSSFVIHFDDSNGTNTQGYARSVMNTNPQKLNTTITDSNVTQDYFLAETYEESLNRWITDQTAQKQFGAMYYMGLNGTSKYNFGYWQRPACPPKTGWFIANDVNSSNSTMTGSFVGSDQDQLFRFVGLHDGKWLQENYQIGIEVTQLGTSVNPYSSFHVYVMDMKQNVIEQFKGCNFNPGSPNFVAKKIGDQNQVWNATQEKYDVRGEYENRSDYIYIELSDQVRDGTLTNMSAVPFGCQGPIIWDDLVIEEGAGANKSSVLAPDGTTHHLDDSMSGYNQEVAHGHGEALEFLDAKNVGASRKVTIKFPRLRLSTQNNKGANNTNYNFKDWLGVDHSKSGSAKQSPCYRELVRNGAYAAGGSNNLSVTASINTTSLTNDKIFSYWFTMDDIVLHSTSGSVYFESGSRKGGTSVTALKGTEHLINELRVRKFKVPLFGGEEGVDIKWSNPFANAVLGNASSFKEEDNYALHSVMKALKTIEDPEVVKYDILSVPGVTREIVTNKVLNICAERGDSLGIIDIAQGFAPAGVEDTSNQTGSIKATIDELDGRQLNTSYGACYYPWIRLRDSLAGNGDVIMAPPSIAGIGAIARSEAVSEPWFAPAGFNRGGIRQLGGRTGPQCVGTWEHLTKQNRDDLYQNNINPIARFPAVNEIVIFGQKTLQQTPSALDRINVRRLMIYLKKTIGQIADTILFDQNVMQTWLRFRGEADRVLGQVQARLGITEYKLILDETTTTPDLIDRNILYAKVFVKPARAIEYIVVDFIITRTGVEF